MRVSDPSTASATVNVIVTVTEVNEAPLFDEDAPSVLKVRENTDPPAFTLDDGDTLVRPKTYAATDQDCGDTCCTYSVTGADRSAFVIDSSGTLSFRAGRKPDLEKKDSYSIAIVARSGDGSRRSIATLDVTVNVVDAEDVGEIFPSQRQPQLGIEIHATASDEDGGVTITSWVWERSEEVTVNERGAPSAECRDEQATPGIDVVRDWTPITGASSAVYTR